MTTGQEQSAQRDADTGGELPYDIVCDSRDREPWLAARRTMITASDVAVVLGISPRSSPLELYLEKLGINPEQEQTEVMQWGLALEPIIIKNYGIRTGRPVKPHGFLLRSKKYPFIGCTMDGTTEIEGEVCPLEAKNTMKRSEWMDEAPLYHRVQVATQVLVFDATIGSIAALLTGNELVYQDLPRDEDLIATIVKACSEFWDAVEKKQPPSPDGTAASKRALQILFPKEREETKVNLGQDAVEWSDEIEKQNAIIKEAKVRLEFCKQQIKVEIGDAEKGVLPGGNGGWTWKLQERDEFTVSASSSRVLRRTKK